MHPESSAIDEKQRNPLLAFYLSALAFVGAFILMEYSLSPWREILRIAMIAIAVFAPCGLCFVSCGWPTSASGGSIFGRCVSPSSFVWF